MSKLKVELNIAELNNIRKSAEMQDICQKHASKIAGRAGKGYAAAAPHFTDSRVIINVYAETKDARRDNLKNNTLLKAMGG